MGDQENILHLTVYNRSDVQLAKTLQTNEIRVF